jgi:hypothetical protein
MRPDKILTSVLRRLTHVSYEGALIARWLRRLLGGTPHIPRVVPCVFRVARVAYSAYLTPAQCKLLKRAAHASPHNVVPVRVEALRLLACVEEALGPTVPALETALAGEAPYKGGHKKPVSGTVPLGACHFQDPPGCQDNLSEVSCHGIPGWTQWDQGESCSRRPPKPNKEKNP